METVWNCFTKVNMGSIAARVVVIRCQMEARRICLHNATR